MSRPPVNDPTSITYVPGAPPDAGGFQDRITVVPDTELVSPAGGPGGCGAGVGTGAGSTGSLGVTGATYAKPFVRMPLCGPGFVTTTSTVPAACAPVTAVIVVELMTFTPVAATPPIDTVAPARKSEIGRASC